MCATKRKSYVISKGLVARAYRLVEANAGAAGVDKERYRLLLSTVLYIFDIDQCRGS